MAEQNEIQLFDGKQVRYVWDEEQEKYFFSVVDVIQVLTDSTTPRRYWSDLKRKLEAEGSEVYEKIVQLKLPAPDGKLRLTDVADTEQVFRLIQSVPSKKAEPFKLWLARDNMTNVELMLNGLAEAAATELSKRENPKGFTQNANVAQRGGDVAHVARERLEQELGDTVISDKRALNFTNPPEELPFNDAEEVK